MKRSELFMMMLQRIILLASLLLQAHGSLIPHVKPAPPGYESSTDSMLREMFKHYDHHQPPMSHLCPYKIRQLCTDPTMVNIGIYVNSFYSISEQQMEYSVNIYLRQSWTDPRLAFHVNQTNGKDKIQLSAEWVSKVWRPDIFFRNEKRANFHHVTIPNLLFRLRKDGFIWYVTKISATLSCMMNLRKYPLDIQTCPMMLESFGHTAEDVMFSWMNNSVETEKTLTMPQFKLLKYLCKDCSQNYTTGTYPCLQANFILKRDIGYFLSQLYVPTVLIVILSWVGFWISIDAIPARVSLGLLTVLTMTTQSSGARSQLPRVSYVKAIDIWTSACLFFVFVSLVEFAVVNVVSRKPSEKHVKRKSLRASSQPRAPVLPTSIDIAQSEATGRSPTKIQMTMSREMKRGFRGSNSSLTKTNTLINSQNGGNMVGGAPPAMDSTHLIGLDREGVMEGQTEFYMNYETLRQKQRSEQKYLDNKEKARRIDKLSRYIFPLFFLIFNCVYWIYYTQVPLKHIT